MESEAKRWIEQVLEQPLGDGHLQPLLKSGVVLCNLVRKLEANSCPKPSASAKPFAQRENIGTPPPAEFPGKIFGAADEVLCAARAWQNTT